MERKLLSRQECRLLQIDILKAIDSICKENNIKYYISYGTLIGAIRHKGFIPWDDDIDISLFRDEYDKLVEILKNQQEYDWLDIIDSSTKGYYYPFVKVVNNNTIAKQEDNITKHGIWVDIFPIDNVPNDKKERVKFINKMHKYKNLVISMTTDFKGHKFGIKKIVKMILDSYSKIIGKENIIKKYERMIIKYDNLDTQYVAVLFSDGKLNSCFKKEELIEQTRVEFEGEKYTSFKNYDKYLKQIYGEYMQLPPEDKRENHNIKVWYIPKQAHIKQQDKD